MAMSWKGKSKSNNRTLAGTGTYNKYRERLQKPSRIFDQSVY